MVFEKFCAEAAARRQDSHFRYKYARLCSTCRLHCAQRGAVVHTAFFPSVLDPKWWIWPSAPDSARLGEAAASCTLESSQVHDFTSARRLLMTFGLRMLEVSGVREPEAIRDFGASSFVNL